MPIILGTPEAEIKRIVVRSLRQIVLESLLNKSITKKGLVECLKV
jgi:hypothetical protein